MARRSVGFFVVVYSWSNNMVSISSPELSISISFTLGNDMTVWDGIGTVFAGYFLAKLFVFDTLSNDFLSLTYGFSSWCANLGYNFFMFNFAVWCNGNWGNNCWGNNCGGSVQKQLWVGISIGSWSS